MNLANYLRSTFTRYHDGLLLLSFIVSMFLTSCQNLIFRGTRDDLFVDSSFLNINVPFWVGLIGSAIYIFMTIWLIRLMYIVDKQEKKDVDNIRFRHKIEVELIMMLVMIVISYLFGSFAVLLDMMKKNYLFTLFFIIQGFILISSSLSTASRIGDYVQIITGSKNKKFETIDIISKALQNKFIDKISDKTIRKENEDDNK